MRPAARGTEEMFGYVEIGMNTPTHTSLAHSGPVLLTTLHTITRVFLYVGLSNVPWSYTTMVYMCHSCLSLLSLSVTSCLYLFTYCLSLLSCHLSSVTLVCHVLSVILVYHVLSCRHSRNRVTLSADASLPTL